MVLVAISCLSIKVSCLSSTDPSVVLLVFAYKRVFHLRQTLQGLALNHGASTLPLRIYIDGPRTESEIGDISDVVSVSKQCSGFRSLQVIERPTNLGLYASLTLGISEALQEYESVLVFEDDHYTSPWCIRYLLDGLLTYQYHPKVASIHAYTPPVKKDLPETFFMRGADCWGWATWRDKWLIFRHDSKNMANEIKIRNLRAQFDLNGNEPYYKMLCDRASGNNNSWAICWHASCFLANKLTLYPGKSLVRNIGLDNSGENCSPELSPLMDSKISMDAVKVELIEASVDKNIFAIYANHFHRSLFDKFLIFVKSSLRRIPFLLIIRNRFFPIGLTLEGSFTSFSEASTYCKGYNSSAVLEKVSSAVTKVLDGEAIYERDGFTFNDKPQGLMVRNIFQEILEIGDSVIDFGGGLGGTYINNRDIIPMLKQFIVVEQANFVLAGNNLMEKYNLPVRFSECIPSLGQSPKLIILSSVLQYIDNPYKVLESILAETPEYVLIDRTAFGRDSLWHLQLNKDVYSDDISYPFRCINKRKMLSYFSGYSLLQTWSNSFDPRTPEHSGLLFRID